MLNEINKYVNNSKEYDADIKENVKECCKAKLKMFFLTYQDEPWLKDVIPTIYKNIPIYNIAKSLLADNCECLKQGYDKLKS